MGGLRLGCCTLAALLVAAGARAHAPEALGSVAEGPGGALAFHLKHGDEGLVLDTGERVGLICSDAIDATAPRMGTPFITARGEILLGLFGATYAGSADGCDWQPVPELDGQWVTRIVADPGDADTLYAATATGTGTEPQDNGLWRRQGEGPWVPMGAHEDLLVVDLRAVVTEAGTRLYALTLPRPVEQAERSDERVSYELRHSDDLGATWTAHAHELDGALRMHAIDPTDGERLVLVVSPRAGDARVVLSRDAGASLEELFRAPAITAVAMAPDGGLWIAGNEADVISGGLWFAPTPGEAPRRIDDPDDPVRINCLHYPVADDTLFACTRYAYGPVDPETGQVTPVVDLHEVPLLECPGIEDACRPETCRRYCSYDGHPCSATCEQLQCGPLVDGVCEPEAPREPGERGGVDLGALTPAGAADAGTGGAQDDRDDGSADAGAGRSTGCHLSPHGDGAATDVPLLAALMLLGARRRRRAHRRPALGPTPGSVLR